MSWRKSDVIRCVLDSDCYSNAKYPLSSEITEAEKKCCARYELVNLDETSSDYTAWKTANPKYTETLKKGFVLRKCEKISKLSSGTVSPSTLLVTNWKPLNS